MPVVTASQVHKSYGAHIVLRAVDLTIRSTERVGVVGKNGAGKSTLARILAGVETADTGAVSRRRGASISYLHQVPTFEGDPTVREAASVGLAAWVAAVKRHEAANQALASGSGDMNALLEQQAASAEEVERLGGWEQQHQVDSMLDHLHIRRPDARMSTLSGGEQRRVALAQILLARPNLAVLDEPTNHLDADTIEWLEEYLQQDTLGAVLLITHDRYLLDRVAQRTIEVADGEVYSYDGGYELYLEQKAERLAHAERTEQNRQNFLRRELEWLRRQPKARSTKQKARIDRAESAKAAPGPKLDRAATFALEVTRSGKTILEARALCVQRGDKPLVSKLDLFVTQGERIGIVGANGSGKTTLLRTLLGQHPPSSGSVTLGQNTRVAYFDQLRSALDDTKSVFENVVGDQSRIEIGGELIDARSYLERFAFDAQKQRQPVGSLSGGERARVAIAKLLRQSANLVVLDEPTNDLDVATLGALESMLVELEITALVVTHDRWFLDRVATSILAFEADQQVIRYPGNYDTYRRLRAQGRAQQPAPAAAPAVIAAPERSGRSAKPKALTRSEEQELAKVLTAIERSEARQAELNAALVDASTYDKGRDGVASLVAELGSVNAEVERLTLRWEELENKKQSSS
ncbi:MAG TPA: ABC-F family ATP-binding cassette domain-containing protein [Polyangiaceae bacterium]|nr:ABC-F family ATP-binding cassette domain-containing protein [Polyangiaceae bacterium]